MKTFAAIIACLLLPALMRAGDWEGYYRLLRKHRDAKQISGHIVTRYYYADKQAPLKTEKGHFYVDGFNSYVNYEGQIALANEKYIVSADKHNKVLMVNRAEGKEQLQALLPGDGFAADSASLQKSVTLSTLKSSAELVVFQLIYKDAESQYEKAEMVFAAGTGVLKKVVYHFRKNSKYRSNPVKVEIEYVGLTINQPAPKGTFNEEQLARISAASVKPAKSYEDYTILDYRNKK